MTGRLLAVTVIAAIAVTIALAAYSSAWKLPDWDLQSTESRTPLEPSSSTALPTLFAVDSHSRRAGVDGWMRRIRGDAQPLSQAPPVPIPYDPSRSIEYDSVTTIGGVNYADVTGSGIPLQWLGDGADRWLSPGLRLRDFVTHDGAPFVRIDPDLVERLERLRERTGDLRVISGYRHPAYNLTVGGQYNSLHTAGRAADVWSPSHTSVELARLALLVMGCDIGIGLNKHAVHVDVRGELTSWTYEESPMSEPAFDAWTLVQCGRPVPSWLSRAAAAEWLSEDADLAEMTEGQVQSTTPRLQSARPSVEGLLAEHASVIVDTYRRGASEEPGGIVLDVRRGPEPLVRFVAVSSPEAHSLGLSPLISWCITRGSAYVAYAVVQQDTTITGVSNELGIGGHAPNRTVPLRHTAGDSPTRGSPSNASSLSDTPNSQPKASTDEPDGWVVIAGSYIESAEAETHASNLEELLAANVMVVAAPDVGRFRIALGPYSSSHDAARARERYGDAVPADAWIAPF